MIYGKVQRQDATTLFRERRASSLLAIHLYPNFFLPKHTFFSSSSSLLHSLFVTITAEKKARRERYSQQLVSVVSACTRTSALLGSNQFHFLYPRVENKKKTTTHRFTLFFFARSLARSRSFLFPTHINILQAITELHNRARASSNCVNLASPINWLVLW